MCNSHFFCCLVESLKSYDAAANEALVEYKGNQLSIDASLLTDFQFRIDSLYEFIGEIQASVEREKNKKKAAEGRGKAKKSTM